MGGFQGGDDAFSFGEDAEGVDGFLIVNGGVGDAVGVFPVGVFGADAGVVEA